MNETPKISRRGFTGLCTTAFSMLGASALFAKSEDAVARNYNRVQLVDANDKPISARQLASGRSYVFHYPYVTTPCYLIDLGKPAGTPGTLKTEAGEPYQWPGGAGPQRSVVAFSAICAHKMSHPTRAVSFINYRHQPVSFRNKDLEQTRGDQVIYCCSEKSVYDPANGAKVLGGPAPQPLAGILLEHDESADAFYAVGTAGGEMFDRFFEKHDFRLAMEYQVTDVREPVAGTTATVPVEEFCRNQILC